MTTESMPDSMLRAPQVPHIPPPTSVSKVPSVPRIFDNEPLSTMAPVDAPQQDLPSIMLEPLHVLDPLALKWGLSVEYTLPALAGVTAAPVAAPAALGQLRLMGLLMGGRPWEQTLDLASLARSGGVVIGREASMAELVVAEASVSRAHARLEWVDGRLYVSDLGSMNGTQVDGRRLDTQSGRIELQDGSVLALGEVQLQVELISDVII